MPATLDYRPAQATHEFKVVPQPRAESPNHRENPGRNFMFMGIAWIITLLVTLATFTFLNWLATS